MAVMFTKKNGLNILKSDLMVQFLLNLDDRLGITVHVATPVPVRDGDN